jgi:hypothetical protein
MLRRTLMRWTRNRTCLGCRCGSSAPSHPWTSQRLSDAIEWRAGLARLPYSRKSMGHVREQQKRAGRLGRQREVPDAISARLALGRSPAQDPGAAAGCQGGATGHGWREGCVPFHWRARSISGMNRVTHGRISCRLSKVTTHDARRTA